MELELIGAPPDHFRTVQREMAWLLNLFRRHSTRHNKGSAAWPSARRIPLCLSGRS